MSHIRLGHGTEFLNASLTNGPGWRVPIWVQGCSVRCTAQCLNPKFLSPAGGVLVDIPSLVARFEAIRVHNSRVEGITVLGGEPFDQDEALGFLLESVRERDFSTMVYTGHVYEDLCKSESAKWPLQLIDVLVDGPFKAEQFGENLAWRGSGNQRLICLTSRYQPEFLERQYAVQGKAFSVHLSGSGFLSVSGLQGRIGAVEVQRDVALWSRSNQLNKD